MEVDAEVFNSESINSLITSSSNIYQNHVHRQRKRLHAKSSGLKISGKHVRSVTKNDPGRFNRTVAILRYSGLLELTAQTSKLLEENIKLQKEIDQLERETCCYRETIHEIQEVDLVAKEIEVQTGE